MRILDILVDVKVSILGLTPSLLREQGSLYAVEMHSCDSNTSLAMETGAKVLCILTATLSQSSAHGKDVRSITVNDGPNMSVLSSLVKEFHEIDVQVRGRCVAAW